MVGSGCVAWIMVVGISATVCIVPARSIGGVVLRLASGVKVPGTSSVMGGMGSHSSPRTSSVLGVSSATSSKLITRMVRRWALDSQSLSSLANFWLASLANGNVAMIPPGLSFLAVGSGLMHEGDETDQYSWHDSGLRSAVTFSPMCSTAVGLASGMFRSTLPDTSCTLLRRPPAA